MAIGLNAVGSINTTAGTLSLAHTIAGANTIFVANITATGTAVINPTPTFAGLPLTQIISRTNSGNSSLWYLINPPSGLGTFNGTLSSAVNGLGLLISLTGVDKIVPIFGSISSAFTGATSGSITTTIKADSWLVGGIFYNNSTIGTSSPTSGQVLRVKHGITVNSGLLDSNSTGLGTLRWTVPSSNGQIVAAEVHANTNLIQSAGTSGIGLAAISSSWLSDTTTGNMIVVGVTITNAVTLGTVTSITDTQGNTYQKAISAAGTAIKVVETELWYAQNITGGAGSVTVNLPVNAVSMYVREYSGQYSTLDVTSSAVGSSATINSGTTATTTSADELLIMCTGDETGGTQTYQAAGAFGDMVGTTTTATGVSMSDNIVSATGAQVGTQTMTVADEWVSVLATFKAAAVTSTISAYKALLGVGQA